MRPLKRIIIHHSGNSNTLDLIRKLHIEKYGWEYIGYHFMIGRNGEVVNGRDIEKIGAHAKGENEDSVGICLLGNFDKYELEKKQKKALICLARELKEKFDIKSVHFHREFSEKSCPGRNISLDLLEEM